MLVSTKGTMLRRRSSSTPSPRVVLGTTTSWALLLAKGLLPVAKVLLLVAKVPLLVAKVLLPVARVQLLSQLLLVAVAFSPCPARPRTATTTRLLSDVSMTSCRHCLRLPLNSSYGSVALLGNKDLEQCVVSMEGRGIVPCVNAVCGRCGKLSVIVYDGSCVHSLALWERLGKYLVP